jgi:hypothetical protein
MPEAQDSLECAEYWATGESLSLVAYCPLLSWIRQFWSSRDISENCFGCEYFGQGNVFACAEGASSFQPGILADAELVIALKTVIFIAVCG